MEVSNTFFDLTDEEKEFLQNTLPMDVSILSSENLTAAFEEVKFYFHHYRVFAAKNPNASILPYIEKRLTRLITLFDDCEGELKENILDRLNSDDKDAIAAAVFLLTSLDLKEGRSAILRLTIMSFLNCPEDLLDGYAEGLKYGLHPGISEEMSFLMQNSRVEIKRKCKSINQFRKSKNFEFKRRYS